MPARTVPEHIVNRGRELVARHGSLRRALRATHTDTSGYDSTEDFIAVLAAQEAERSVPAGRPHPRAPRAAFVVRPAGADPHDPHSASGLDNSIELALRRHGGQRVRVTVRGDDGSETSWRAVWADEQRTGHTLRLGFRPEGDPASRYPPILVERSKVRGAAYAEFDGRAELRIGLTGGGGIVVAGTPGPTS